MTLNGIKTALARVLQWGWRALLWTLDTCRQDLPRILDWLIDVTAQLLVLGIGGAGLWIAYTVLFAKDPNHLLIESVPHWPAVAILLVPLLYRPVTTFLNEMEEAFGARRRAKEAIDQGKRKKAIRSGEPE